MAKVGVAYIEIKPDLSGFAQELKAKLTALPESHVDVKVKPDMDNFSTTVRSSLSALRPGRLGGESLGQGLGETVATTAGRSMFSNFLQVFAGMPQAFMNPVSAAASIIGIALAGQLVAALSGALIPLLAGLSLVGLGLFGAARNQEVKDAAKRLGQTFTAELDKATSSFKPETLKALDIFSKAIKETFTILKPVFDALAPVVPVLAQAFADMGTELAKAMADPKFLAAMKDMILTLAANLPGVGRALGDIFRMIGEHGPQVKLVMQGLMLAVMGAFKAMEFVIDQALIQIGIYRLLWESTTTWIKTAWAAVVAWWKQTLPDIKAGWTEFTTAIRNAWNAATEWVKARWNEFTSSFQANVDKIKAGWNSFTSTVKTAFTGAIDSVVNLFTGLPGRIRSAMGNAASLLSDVGTSIVDGMANGIRNSWGRVSSAVQGLLNKIPVEVRKLLGIGSPSKVMARLGREVPRGFARGITRDTPEVTGALKAMMGLPRAAQAPVGSIAPQGSTTPSVLAVLSIDGKFFDLRVEQLIAAGSDVAARDLLAGRRV